MSESVARHIIAFFGTLAFLLAYLSGYISGSNGWFWTGIGIIFVYMIIYTLVDA